MGISLTSGWRAADILKEKGVKNKPFPTNKLLMDVAKWFRNHELKDSLYLMSKRFVEMNPAPEFYVDNTNIDQWVQDMDFSDYLNAKNAGLIVPHYLIDEPYFVNAVAMLQTLGGYVVKKERKKKVVRYKVTLI